MAIKTRVKILVECKQRYRLSAEPKCSTIDSIQHDFFQLTHCLRLVVEEVKEWSSPAPLACLRGMPLRCHLRGQQV